MKKDKHDINLGDVLMDQIESDVLEVPLANRVFKIALVLTLVLVIGIFVRLLGLSIFSHSFYTDRALANVNGIVFQPAPRGIIFDNFDEPLVINEAATNVFLNIGSPTSNWNIELDKIAAILNVPVETLEEKIKIHDWDRNYRLLLTDDISHDQLVEFTSAVIPNIELAPGLKRHYFDPLIFSHVVGYMGLVDASDLERNQKLVVENMIGKSGLEYYYDQSLRGVNGKEIIFYNALGEIEDQQVINFSESGNDLYTFIDASFQKYFYNRLQKELRRLGSKVGVGIALDPRNGKVLALINVPGFDGSRIIDFLNKPYQPLFNRAISGLYNPGSTIKPLVATAALKEGIINPQKEIFSAGYIEVPNPYNPSNPSRFLDWKPHGWVNLYSALARSSNVYFYQIGGGFDGQKGLGINKLKKWWAKFGLDQLTQIDLREEKKGFLPDPEWKETQSQEPWRLGDTYNVSIGQGDILVTPLGLLNYLSAIANGGYFYQPRIMKMIKKDGKLIMQSKPVLLQDLSQEIAQEISEVQKGLIDAVEKSYGTAHFLSDLPLKVAAKTGTAQVQNNTKLNAFFIGYAPVDNPQIALLVLVEDAKEGSLNAVPVAKDVLLWYYNNRIKK